MRQPTDGTGAANPGARFTGGLSGDPAPTPDRRVLRPLLAARGLRRAVDGRVLWHDLHVQLRAGERLALVGPSGSGKSLLLRALAGLDPLEAGEVLALGRPQARWAMPEYRSTVLYLPQRPTFDGGRIGAALERPFALRVRRGRAYPAERALALLAALGRDTAFLEQPTDRLSGGEAQLTALVRALLLDPKVLLLDEATAALDPQATALAERLLLDWCAAEPDRALVWVGHDARQRARMATRALAIAPGQAFP